MHSTLMFLFALVVVITGLRSINQRSERWGLTWWEELGASAFVALLCEALYAAAVSRG